MVCMPGHYKMAAVLKLVMMENHAIGTPEEVNNEKIAAQILHNQLFDAYEPNLLDEEDMDVFGSRPMADPLDLVCCNTCKRPVKASQYAAHAERCSSENLNTDNSVGVDGDTGPKKPPRKGRKITVTSNGNQKIHIKVKGKSQPENRNNVTSSELNNENKNKSQPLNSGVDQRLTTSVDHAAVINASERCLRDAPVPLATKMYHSQGNYRLRLQLGHLYHEAFAEHSGSYTTPNSSQENGVMASQFSPCDNTPLYGAQKGFVPQTKNLERLLPKSSEVCIGVSQELSAVSLPNQLQPAKSWRTDMQVAAVRNETAKSKYNTMAVPYSENSGETRTQQQANGSVPVI